MSETTIKKSVLVPHSAAQMFELVDKVEDYAQFLPWYGKTEVLSRENQELKTELKARLHMDYMGVKQSFATHNINLISQQPELYEIQMNLLDGPFKTLYGTWKFFPIDSDLCKIEFELHYELVGILSKIISPVFSMVTGQLVDSFVKEANKKYK